METVKMKLSVDPVTGMIFLTNDSGHEMEISVHGTTNRDPKKPFHLKKDSILFLHFHQK